MNPVSSSNQNFSTLSFASATLAENPNVGAVLNGELQHLPEVPQSELLNLLEVVHKPNVQGATPEQRTKCLQALFNNNRPELFMVESRVIGSRVEPGQVRLIHLNNVPELVTSFDGPREFRPGKGLDVRDECGIFKESDLFYGAKGMYVVNVPQGKYALAWVGTEPIILDQGTHVISSPNLKPISENSLINQGELTFHHGNLWVIRVLPGYLACITLNNEPYVLSARREPYVFRSALLQFDPKTDFVDAAAPYVRIGALHVLQVPKGKIATVWVGPKPALLHHRTAPYIVYDNLFRLQTRNGQQVKRTSDRPEELFFGANEEIIRHGSIKRIIPRTGHVAVIYDNGHLQVLRPTEDGRPVVFDSENVTVGDMFNVQKQTLRFPSEKTKREREREYQGADRKAINYEVFTTANGARYGVKLLVVFSVSDPFLTLTNFRPDDIVPHLENLVVTEMNKAIQATESTSFLQTKPRAQAAPLPSSDPNVASAPPFYASAQDEIKDHLCRDLRDVGIEVDRVSIEESVPMDQAVIDQMAQFAVRNKKITLEVALLERESQIAEQQARQVAMRNTILRQTEFEMQKRRAQVELECARLRAEVFRLQAVTRQQQLQSIGKIVQASPPIQSLQVASAVYGPKSVLPALNQNNNGATVGAPIMRPVDFFASSYVPNPSTFINPSDAGKK